MGTPAFPNLGKHCSVNDCRQIDFLPFTCDCCHKVFCLEHRSYARHQCPKGNKHDVTVVICPLCAKGVRLIPDEDPNITWQSHVNTDCDPSNYEKATKKRKCPVPRCKEVLTFSNTIKCRDCDVDHCLKHRFGPDHNCPGPKKPEPSFQFLGFLSRKEEPKKAPAASSSRWTTSLLNGIAKLSNEFNQALQIGGDGGGQSSVSKQQVEQCPLCNLRFSTGTALVDHVQKVHEKNGVMNVSIDVCPRCSKGFRDPVSLVEHVERDHGGKQNQRSQDNTMLGDIVPTVAPNQGKQNQRSPDNTTIGDIVPTVAPSQVVDVKHHRIITSNVHSTRKGETNCPFCRNVLKGSHKCLFCLLG